MQKFEREFLENKPNFEWVVRLQTKISEIDKEVLNQYKLPNEIENLLDNLPCDVIDMTTELLSNIDNATSGLENCLTNQVTPGGVNFSDYQSAVEEKNFPVIDDYENHNCSSLNGKIQAEIYSTLKDIKTEFQDFRDFLNEYLLDDQARYDNMSVIRKKELEVIDQIIVEDIKNPGTPDLTSLGFKALIAKAAKDRTQNALQFTNNAIIVSSLTSKETFGGEPTDLVKELVNIPQNILQEFKVICEINFAKQVDISNEIRRRITRLGSPDLKQMVNIEAVKIGKLKSQTSASIINWAGQNDIDEASSPMSVFLEGLIEVLEDIDEAYSNQILDLYKHNELDRLQKEDYILALKEKKKARQMYNITKEILDKFDFDDSNRERQIKRFIQNQGLNRPVNICSS